MQTKKLARSLRWPRRIIMRNDDIECAQIGLVSLAVHGVLLPATYVTALRAHLCGVIIKNMGNFYKEVFNIPGCGPVV